MLSVIDAIRGRHSTRGSFDTSRPITPATQKLILEAAQWAPTPTNMQNFDIVVVDAKEKLDAIGRIPAEMSENYLRENYAQLSSSDITLSEKKTGMLASDFPAAWTNPEAWDPYSDSRTQLTFLARAVGETPLLLIVCYDGETRAPGSTGDEVGLMGLGCVMENMWLVCEAEGVAFHVLTVVNNGLVESQLKDVLHIPAQMKIAFACSIGYPADPSAHYVRVRRDLGDFVHHNEFIPKAIAELSLSESCSGV